jgi:hypothetical protein
VQTAGKSKGKDESTEVETKLIPFPKQDERAVCDTLSSNLGAYDLVAWTGVDAKSLVTQHLSEKNTTDYAKNGKIMMTLQHETQEMTEKTIVMSPVK